MLLDAPDVAAVRLMDSVQPLEEEHAEHGHEDVSYDEHIWTSPVNMPRHAQKRRRGAVRR